MAWARASIEIKPASIGTGIKASLMRTKKSPARMTFTVSDSVGKSLGWQSGDKIEIMIGEGEHHGLLRLRKNNSAGQAEAHHREMARGSWFTLRLGHQPLFIDRSEPASWCQWERVEDGWIEVVLPKWADETAPKQKSIVPAQTVPRHQTPTPRKAADVTGSLMGDPDPARRAMLDKAR